jgi:hypothetical protein
MLTVLNLQKPPKLAPPSEYGDIFMPHVVAKVPLGGKRCVG